ncbi:MAG: hypothetical protein IKI97_04935 [Clostridia bacterium]|nr:hypothetical protein [Clostridia bacterium]
MVLIILTVLCKSAKTIYVNFAHLHDAVWQLIKLRMCGIYSTATRMGKVTNYLAKEDNTSSFKAYNLP